MSVNALDGIDLYKQRVENESFSYRPLISIIVPTYNTPEVFFREMVDSVFAQTYSKWELVLVDDASSSGEIKKLIREYAAKDSRVVYKFLKENKHIAGATNEGIKKSTGEFVSLFDHDDLLWPNALHEIAKVLNNQKTLDFIYTDEDKIVGEDRRKHQDPFLKPDWNPELLRSINYITHFSTIRRSVLDKFGYEDSKYNGAQDWELFLRITRNIKPENIYHIPKIVYSWRVHENSTSKNAGIKPYVVEAQKNALIDDAISRGIKDFEVKQDPKTNYWSIFYGVTGKPLVSIVIPTKNQYEITRQCIESIYKISTYDNFEIILVDTGSDDKRVIDWYKKLLQKNDNIKIEYFVEDRFSYARSCNYGAARASGDFLLMLNNDIEVITPDWIEKMVGYAQQPSIGAVGVKLLYPDKKSIQHAGVGVGVGGCAAHLFSFMTDNDSMTLSQSVMLKNIRNISAVTAACVIFRKEVFDEVQGFKEKYRINYNDIDLCLRIKEAGYNNVFIPHVSLLHYESISRGLPNSKGHDNTEFDQAQRMFRKDWQKYIDNDPALNPNIRKNTSNYDLNDLL